jgi:hypothetical protein
MATIRDRYVLEVDTSGASRGLSTTGTAVAGLGTRIAALGPIAAAAAAALGGMAVVSGIRDTINDMDDLAKSARLAGAAADPEAFRGFQVLQQAMAEAGVDAATFDRAMLQTTSRLQEGVEGGEAFAGIVDKMGDRIRNADGTLVDGATALQEMINALNEGTISTDEFAKVVGGRAGPLIQQQFASLNTSAEDLQATLADVEANSNIVSLDAANNAEVFNDTLGRLGEVAGQLGTDIATALLPILTDLAEGALAILPGIIDGVKAAFEALSPIIDALIPVWEALFNLLEALWPVFETLLSVIGPVAEIIGGALTLAIQGVTTVIETVINTITRMIEGLQGIADKVGEISAAVGQKWDNMTSGLTDGAKDAYNGVTGWFGQMYDEVVGNSIIPDMSDDVLKVFDAMNKGMGDKTASGASDVARGFDAVANNISSGFNSYANEALRGVDSLVDQISGGMFSKINNLSSSLGSSFGGVVNSVGGLFGNNNLFDDVIGGIGDLFGGFFANGGSLPAGKFGVVGERGPELITGPANITPFDQLGGQQVIYNINAVDARSFRDLLARDPGYIHALAQKGASRVPGRFA